MRAFQSKMCCGKKCEKALGAVAAAPSMPRNRTRAETLHPHCSSMAMKSPAQQTRRGNAAMFAFPSEKLGMDLLVSKQCLPWTMARGRQKMRRKRPLSRTGRSGCCGGKEVRSGSTSVRHFPTSARCRARRASGRQRARTRMRQPVAPRAQPTRAVCPRRAGPQGSGRAIPSLQAKAPPAAPRRFPSARPVRQGIFARAPPAMRVPGRSG